MRTRRSSRHVLAVPVCALAACLAVLLSAAPAMAGRPAPGGRYYGLTEQPPKFEDVQDFSAKLHTSRSGRKLAAAELNLLCGRSRSDAVKLSLHGNRAATIKRDGSFSFPAAGPTREAGRMRLWLSGRFVSARYVRLFYRVRNSVRRHSPGCRATDERKPDDRYPDLVASGARPRRRAALQRMPQAARHDASADRRCARLRAVRTLGRIQPWVQRSRDARVRVRVCEAGTPCRPGSQLRRCAGRAATAGRRAAGLRTRRLRPGRMRVCHPGPRPDGRHFAHRVADPAQRPRSRTGVGDLVLKESGSLAWTVARYALDRRRVHRLRGRGRSTARAHGCSTPARASTSNRSPSTARR